MNTISRSRAGGALTLLLTAALTATACASPATSSSPTTVVSAPADPQPNSGGSGGGDLSITTNFEPIVSYLIPDGWTAEEPFANDLRIHRDVDSSTGYEGGNAVGIFANAVAASQTCTDRAADDVGDSAKELTAWAADLDGVVAEVPELVQIGGLPGVSVRLSLESGFDAPCTAPGGEEFRYVPLIKGAAPSPMLHVLTEGLTTQLIVLDTSEGNVTIEIASYDDQIDPEEYAALVAPILESLQFE